LIAVGGNQTAIGEVLLDWVKPGTRSSISPSVSPPKRRSSSLVTPT